MLEKKVEVRQRVQDGQRQGIREPMCPSWPGIASGFKLKVQQPRKPLGPRHTGTIGHRGHRGEGAEKGWENESRPGHPKHVAG